MHVEGGDDMRRQYKRRRGNETRGSEEKEKITIASRTDFIIKFERNI